ncbi:LuxR C-terminal-related transcriptional regulator [Bacteroides gallinaceum]|uniref:response regulator transcription factor n=1 Tax=Bacteroides gallinaceum TaxID=1462571 RepID=UPI0025AA7758|nr:LuxR C-terminal-related transcriptional regulator [Bacteroides gallinaceum]MDN0080973.1 LuxR C-terminal-related transcriptional regulator [Bacteroides gallinaceum]
MHTAVRGYVPVCHRMYYVISPQTGNVVFALCLYTLCAALLPDVLVDSLTGSRTGIDCQSCGNLLSKREREVLLLIAQGKMSKEIADRLSISIHTVSRHRQNILEKLHVGNSIRALDVARELHLL